MIVVINPSGNPGHSFKGLHTYLAHDSGSSTSERLEWTETHNIALNDPHQAYKIMIATASRQNELKKAAGIRAGRKSKHGAVDHIIMSFHEDAPSSKEDMIAAAHELLTSIGAKKSNRKNGKTRTQFADEHQAIIYAHSDGGARHIHIMLNRVHPEHGVRLPDNNDQLKASAWAEKYMDRHNINACHNRKINNEARKKGEYVKAENRIKHHLYEQQQALSNDNKNFQNTRDIQRKKDAALAQKGRDLEEKKFQAWKILSENHKARKQTLLQENTRAIKNVKIKIRENFRPEWRELYKRQAAEIKTFEALEKNFFGRAKNMAHATAMLREHVRGESFGSMLSRGFKILSNAGSRREHFNKAQKSARKALQRNQSQKVSEATSTIKNSLSDKLIENKGVFDAERNDLILKQAVSNAKFKAEWQKRTNSRAEAWRTVERREKLKQNFVDVSPPPLSDYVASLLERHTRAAFRDKKQDLTKEQDNDNEQER